MRTISRTGRFKRDFKRVKAGQLGPKLDNLLAEALALLADDRPLPWQLRDHPLAGERMGYRDCHLRPDMVLIYRKPDEKTLELVRLGSHSELGL
jgi:mRNA interferase YafQ